MTIYTHSPTVKVFKDDHYMDRMYDRIYITGEEENVSKAVVEFNKLVISLSFFPLILVWIVHCIVQRCISGTKQDRLDHY